MTDIQSGTQGNILIIDDSPQAAALVSLILKRIGYSTTIAVSGAEGLAIARATPHDLALVDLMMPDMDGYEVCQHMRADERLRDVPAIVTSAALRPNHYEKALEAGAVDFIAFPTHPEEIAAHVKHQVEVGRLRRENQRLRELDHERTVELNRMKDRFVRGLSHDLKNAIGIVQGYAELLVEEGSSGSNSQVQYFAGRIQRGAKQLVSIVNSLVDLARIEESIVFALEPVSLAAALQLCLDEARMQVAGKQIELVIAPIPEVTLLADPARLSQAVNNLLSNAIKYTPAGGRIEVQAQVEGGEVVIKVTDTGLGIPADDVAQLFKKFYRVNRPDHIAHEGAGLGLYITKAIIERHNGRVAAESVPGTGSVFTIVLPITH